LHCFLPDILWLQLSASLVFVQAIWRSSVVLSSSSSSSTRKVKVKKVARRGRVGVSEEEEAPEMVMEQEITSHG
jgi:hypothetical protein